jgi:hypothetical protein
LRGAEALALRATEEENGHSRVVDRLSPSETDSVGQEGPPGSPGPTTGRVTAGPFILEIGAPAGTRALDPADERADTRAQAPLAAGPFRQSLDRALKKDNDDAPEPGGKLGAETTAVVDEASEVTTNAERARDLFAMVATGRLEPEAVRGEVDALLTLLERLDGEGRWAEALHLARALSSVSSWRRGARGQPLDGRLRRAQQWRSSRQEPLKPCADLPMGGSGGEAVARCPEASPPDSSPVGSVQSPSRA